MRVKGVSFLFARLCQTGFPFLAGLAWLNRNNCIFVFGWERFFESFPGKSGKERFKLNIGKMEANYYFTIRSIVALVLGVLLVVWPDVAINYLVITVGVLFFVPGVLSLAGYFWRRRKEKIPRSALFPVAGVGSLLFGLWLMIMPSFFVNILMYVLGFILILGGIQQIVFLASARRYASVSAGFYVVPVLLLVAGFVVLLNPFDVASAAFVVLGISCIVYAVSELFNGFRFRRRRAAVEEVEAGPELPEDA